MMFAVVATLIGAKLALRFGSIEEPCLRPIILSMERTRVVILKADGKCKEVLIAQDVCRFGTTFMMRLEEEKAKAESADETS
jgi:hypothetical protein